MASPSRSISRRLRPTSPSPGPGIIASTAPPSSIATESRAGCSPSSATLSTASPNSVDFRNFKDFWLGVEVRREKILREIGYRARSGACRLREKDLIIIDREMEPSEQIEVFVEALRSRDLEELYLSPEARRLLQGGFE